MKKCAESCSIVGCTHLCLKSKDHIGLHLCTTHRNEFVAVDLTAPELVEVVIREDGKTVWVNTEARCVFRACQVKKLVIEDRRESKYLCRLCAEQRYTKKELENLEKSYNASYEKPIVCSSCGYKGLILYYVRGE